MQFINIPRYANALLLARFSSLIHDIKNSHLNAIPETALSLACLEDHALDLLNLLDVDVLDQQGKAQAKSHNCRAGN